jgi:hypothetical protein
VGIVWVAYACAVLHLGAVVAQETIPRIYDSCYNWRRADDSKVELITDTLAIQIE